MICRTTPSLSLDEAHYLASDDLNRWRGRCVHLFALIEEALGETIEAIVASGQDKIIKRQPMFGKRVEALRAALCGDRPYAKTGKPVVAALDRLTTQLARRNIVVHATGTILLDCKGKWSWHYRFTPSDKSARVESQISQDDAHAFEKQLTAHGRSLRDVLRNLRAAINDGPVAV